MYPVLSTPSQMMLHFSGFSALRQGLHLSPSAMLPAVLSLLFSSLLQEARSSLLLPFLNQQALEREKTLRNPA
jgi:hypothetical protein